MSDTDVLLAVIDRLTARVVELEAWKVRSEEVVTTKMIRAEGAEFTRPKQNAPFVQIGPVEGITVSGGRRVGPHVNITVERAGDTDVHGRRPARAGVYAYADEDDLGVSIEAMARPDVRKAAGEVVVYDTEGGTQVEIANGVEITPSGPQRITLHTHKYNRAAITAWTADDLSYENGMEATLLASLENPDGTAGLNLIREGNEVASLVANGGDYGKDKPASLSFGPARGAPWETEVTRHGVQGPQADQPDH